MSVRRSQRWRLKGERGAVTAEYALLVTAGVAFAGAMVWVVSSGGVRAALEGIVMRALGG